MKIHIDLDAFFVSAECTRDPSLRRKPVAVGGRGDWRIFHESGAQECDFETRGSFLGAFFHARDPSADDLEHFLDDKGRLRGIVMTASYEARRFGITTGMSLHEAKLRCAPLIVKAPDMALYKRLSHALHDFLIERMPLIEQASIDEFYGDLGGWIADAEVPCFIDLLRHEIKAALDLSVSIGAAPTKSIAKLATGRAKPFGSLCLFADEIHDFIEAIEVGEFPGIGRSMRRRLEDYKIKTLGELIRAKSLVCGWGPYAQRLYEAVCGLDHEPIKAEKPRQSIGISRSFSPLLERMELRRRVLILSRHLAFAITRLEVLPTHYSLSIRYEFTYNSTQACSDRRLFSEAHFKSLCFELLSRADRHPSHRVVGLALHASHFTCNSRRTLDLLTFESDRAAHRLSCELGRVRQRYGLDALRWGGEMAQNDTLSKNSKK
ncbi:MAG: DNA polymerase IV [Campylobacterales bacterium]|nr:DNA polymerase IV [Campylobacterales bacterium]